MDELPRQQIDELITLYALNPDAADIFVEGRFDADVLRLFLKHGNASGKFSVKEIDGIDVSSEVVTGYGLKHGSNKARVIALALALGQALPATGSNIAGIVDIDTDEVLGRLLQARLLLYTDYCSMETYFATDDAVDQFLVFVCRCPAGSHKRFFALADVILTNKFCLRAAIDRLGLTHPVIGWEQGLRVKGNWDSFSSDTFLRAYLRRPDPAVTSDEISRVFFELLGAQGADRRSYMNGHDFIEFLFQFASATSGFRLRDKGESVLEYGGRMVASTSLAVKSLESEPLFKLIAGAAAGSSTLN